MKKLLLSLPFVALVALYFFSKMFDVPKLYQYGAIFAGGLVAVVCLYLFSCVETDAAGHPGTVFAALGVYMVILFTAHPLAYGSGHSRCFFDSKSKEFRQYAHQFHGTVLPNNDPKDVGQYMFVDFGKKLGVIGFAVNAKKPLLAGAKVVLAEDTDLRFSLLHPIHGLQGFAVEN